MKDELIEPICTTANCSDCPFEIICADIEKEEATQERNMKIIYSNIIPFKGYVAINLFGVLFARNEYKGHISDVVINHEEIHTEQMRELLYIGFYLWYVIEWLIKLPFHKNAYRAISFEREAYAHQTKTPEGMYIYRKVVRKRFAFLKYL